MDAQQEFQRLKQAFKKRDQKRQNVYIANVVDVTPRAESGYIVVRLKDGTQVYAHVWMNEQIDPNQVVFIVPITHEAWNWWVVIGVNATTAPETVPYVQPAADAASLPAHPLTAHSGTLPWDRIDRSENRVDLSSDIQGVLPLANQQSQTRIGTFEIATGQIAAGATATGLYNMTTNSAFVKRIELSGGTQASLELSEPGGALQYATIPVTTPYTDNGGLFLTDFSGSSSLRWRVTNTGGSPSGFVIRLWLIMFATTVITTAVTRTVEATAVMRTPDVGYEVHAQGYVVETDG